MLAPLDLARLAHRIEALERTSTYDWHPADQLDFRNRLPSGRLDARFRLPNPADLRDPEVASKVSVEEFRNWTRTVLNLEGLASRNRPGSPQKMMRDMARGRFPLR